jgi:FKBP-type peptidyl-prolyl cis-trans isomerase FkpA
MKIKVIGIVLLSALLFSGCDLSSDVTSGSEQLASDLAAIDTYLSVNGIVALRDVNGIRFTIDSIGSGFPPLYNSTVKLNYTGKLLSGTIFQTGTISNKVSDLISGLQIGLPLIPNGTKATFYIPSVYAYGSQAQGNIPPNSNLIFQVFLNGITVTETEKNQLKSDTVEINNYLAAAGVSNAVKDTSGLQYVIKELGTGATPSWLNKVKVVYTGYIINDDGTLGSKFYSGNNEPNENNDSRVVNFIRGFQIGLQQMPNGSKADLYMPSGLGFGAVQVSGGLVIVPPNSNLKYEVELIDVLQP